MRVSRQARLLLFLCGKYVVLYSVGLVADTSAVVAIERGGTDLGHTFGELGEFGDEPIVTPAIVYAELLAGAALTPDPVRAAAHCRRVSGLTVHVLSR